MTNGWAIIGIGLNADRVEPYLDKDKVLDLLFEQLPNEAEVRELIHRRNNKEDYSFDIWDFTGASGSPFDGVADLLTYCDDTDSLTFGYCGYSDGYLYYPPSMPWHMTETEPKTPEEVHRRIIAAVQKITTLGAEEIEALIDDELSLVTCE